MHPRTDTEYQRVLSWGGLLGVVMHSSLESASQSVLARRTRKSEEAADHDGTNASAATADEEDMSMDEQLDYDEESLSIDEEKLDASSKGNHNELSAWQSRDTKRPLDIRMTANLTDIN